MRGMSAGVAAMVWAFGAAAQPADCMVHEAPGPSLPLAIDLARRPGVPRGVTGQAYVELPLGAPQTDCGEPSVPRDVLRGEAGDLLRGTRAPDSMRGH